MWHVEGSQTVGLGWTGRLGWFCWSRRSDLRMCCRISPLNLMYVQWSSSPTCVWLSLCVFVWPRNVLLHGSSLCDYFSGTRRGHACTCWFQETNCECLSRCDFLYVPAYPFNKWNMPFSLWPSSLLSIWVDKCFIMPYCGNGFRFSFTPVILTSLHSQWHWKV